MVEQRGSREDRRRARGRPRSVESTQAILNTTMLLLAEQGYTRMSLDEVARRAQVGKDTLYRRWPSKVELVRDAILQLAAEGVPVPDTGSLHGDLVRYLTSIIDLVTTTNFGRIVAGLVGEAGRNPELAEGFRGFWEVRRQTGRRIIERAIERGELRPDVQLDLALDLLLGPVYYRLLLSGFKLDHGYAEELVEHVIHVLVAVP